MPIRPRTPSCRGRAGTVGSRARRASHLRAAGQTRRTRRHRRRRGARASPSPRRRGQRGCHPGRERAGMTGGGAQEERGGRRRARAWWASKLARLGSGRKGGFTVRASRASQSIAANQACARTFVPSPSAPSRAATSGSSSVRTSDGAQSPSAGAKDSGARGSSPQRSSNAVTPNEYQSKDRPYGLPCSDSGGLPRQLHALRRGLGRAAAGGRAVARRTCTRASPSSRSS